MIFSTRHGDRQVAFAFQDQRTVPPPGTMGAAIAASGQRVTVERAYGLPVVSRAVRLISETVGMMEPAIYERRDGFWQPQEDAPEARLFTSEPNPEQHPFDFYSFMAACHEGWGNYYAWKARVSLPGTAGPVVALLPLLPSHVTPKVDGHEVTYKVRDDKGGTETFSRGDILHVPGVLLTSPYIGVSPIALHRDPLGRELGLEEWQGSFYRNDATPPIAISSRHFANEDKRKEFLDGWQARHQGSGRAHLPALLWGEEMTLQSIGIAPRDAEYVETRKTGVREAANIFGMDSGMLNDPDANRENPEHTMIRFLTLTAGPRVARIWRAISRDRDLFPDATRRLGFSSAELMRPDAKTQAEVDLRRRQSGTRTANELRAKDGVPPHPDGDELQATPVGGAPNEKPAKGSPEADDAAASAADDNSDR